MRSSRVKVWVSALRVGASVAALGLGAALTSCSTTSSSFATGPVYPTHKAQTRVLDIQVIRRQTRITLTNTSAESLHAGRMWVNAEYALDFDGLGIGESTTLSLLDFRNEFSETFRAGGFFATRIPADLVQVQLEDESGLTGLIVVNGRWTR